MTCLDCGRSCSGRRCRDCERDRRWEDEYERTLGDDRDDQDHVRTDGAGSKYVRETGAGYHTTRRVGKGSVAVTITDTDLGWTKGDPVQIGAPETDQLFVGTSLPADPEPMWTTTVTTSQYRSARVRIPLSALDEIGVATGDEIRAYEDDDRLVIVDAADDPRVDQQGGGVSGD